MESPPTRLNYFLLQNRGPTEKETSLNQRPKNAPVIKNKLVIPILMLNLETARTFTGLPRGQRWNSQKGAATKCHRGGKPWLWLGGNSTVKHDWKMILRREEQEADDNI